MTQNTCKGKLFKESFFISMEKGEHPTATTDPKTTDGVANTEETNTESSHKSSHK